MMAAVLALRWAPAEAGPNEVMDNMFDVYTNTTDPRILDTQRRGGVTLGRFSARTPISAPKLISYTPPAINGGCSGIDLYGGSFSFIDKDQMTQALRDIASGAVSYAFTLSLQSVCPPCMQTMQALRDQVDEINAMMRDSCHWATTLVDSTNLDVIHERQMGKLKVEQANALHSDDVFEAANNATTALSAERALDDVRQYNAVWKIMKDGGMATWFGSGVGDDALLEVIMSITGTMVKTENHPDTAAPCPNDRGWEEFCSIDKPSLLSVNEFIDGGNEVQVYSCGGDANCLNPAVATVTDWRGFSARIRDLLFGVGASEGILEKKRLGTIALTPAETAFLATAPGPIYDILNSAVMSEGSAVTLGVEIQNTVAAILARQLVMELIFAVEDAFGLEGIPIEKKLRDSLAARQREFTMRNDTVQTDLSTLALIFDIRNDTRQGAALQQGLTPVE